MDLVQFFGYLRQFNADVVLIGAAVWGLTALLKNTALKKVPKKYITLLPFALGILLYVAFAALTGGFSADALAGIITSGISCGSLDRQETVNSRIFIDDFYIYRLEKEEKDYYFSENGGSGKDMVLGAVSDEEGQQ